ncbi:MAG: beta-phosphoglucomutase [Clostridia bacterium]|nr:beta-phosphoglucomutase [Clostridia bacterium]
MKFKGIIYDLDGVICSTDEYHYQGWKRLADEIGVYFDRTINARLRGVSRMESLDILLERSTVQYTQEEKVELATRKNNYYRELLSQMTPADLSDEVKNTLDALRAGGVKLAIGSSSKNAKFIIGRIGLGDYFDAISDGNNITRSKPDPEVFTKAAEMLSLPAEDCLVVEDALAGIEAGTNGGFKTASIGYAAEHGAGDYVMKTFSDLIGIVL